MAIKGLVEKEETNIGGWVGGDPLDQASMGGWVGGWVGGWRTYVVKTGRMVMAIRGLVEKEETHWPKEKQDQL